MVEVTEHPPGTFCWPELITTDQKDAKRFYSGLFDWVANDIPTGPAEFYTMMTLDGLDVAAIYTLPEERRAQGIPTRWLTFFAVTNADETARKARELGGQIHAGPFDVLDAGRTAVIGDPSGAVFAVWQAKSHIGAGRVEEPGTLCWTELMTSNTDAAGTFYRQLFAWAGDETPMGPGSYTVFKDGVTTVAGMMEKPAVWANMPAHWGIYFAVEDCDDSAALARDLGGKILMPPNDSPYGRFAVIQDPQGATFSIIALTNPGA